MRFRLGARAIAAAALLAMLPLHVSADEASGVPVFDLKKTCSDAKAFGTPSERTKDYKSCLDDEEGARKVLVSKWSSIKERDKRQCLVGGPDPSYVELLTCLQMDLPQYGGGKVPAIGGPVAPGVPPPNH